MFDLVSLVAGGKLLWDSYGEDFLDWIKVKGTDKAKEQVKEQFDEQWKKFKWKQAEEKYRTKMARLYGQTRIFGNSEPTPLEGIFTDLYVLDKPLALRRYNLDDLKVSDEKLHGKDVSRCNGVEFVKNSQNNKLFILGKPGAGKTTFLKYLTVQTLKGELPYTPIFIGLREWAESEKSLMAFIEQQFEECDFPMAEKFVVYLLMKKRAILLFDGLDEVNADHLARVQREVKSHCRQYDQTLTLVTCRVASADYSFDAFKYVEVADFTPDQVAIFVNKWFAKDTIKCDKFLIDFQHAEHRGLQELARSPLLLGMLCLAFDDSMEFTTRRADIYEDAIDALLRKWDSSRAISRDGIYKNLNHHLKKRVFSAIAYQTFAANQYLLKEGTLAELLTTEIAKLPEIKKPNLDGEAVLKKIEEQHGIFVERAQKIHSFAHLTFQEYFAACAIKGSPIFQKELMQHIHEPRWREVFLLTASLLDNAEEFFSMFQNQLANTPRLQPALVWVKRREKQITSAEYPTEVRFLLLTLTLTLAHAHELTFTFTHGHAHAYAHALDYDCDFALALARTLDLDLDLVIDLDLAIESALDSAFALAFALTRELKTFFNSPTLASEYLLYLIYLLVRTILTRDLPTSHKTLAFISANIAQLHVLRVSLPSLKQPCIDWKIVCAELERELKQRGLLEEFQIVVGQNALNTYFNGNRLLLDCLAVATVTDRDAIRNSLFLPPEESASGG